MFLGCWFVYFVVFYVAGCLVVVFDLCACWLLCWCLICVVDGDLVVCVFVGFPGGCGCLGVCLVVCWCWFVGLLVSCYYICWFADVGL